MEMPSSQIIYKYPLDLTGINPNNLVPAEPHTLPAGINRAIVPNYGAYYAKSLVVRDTGTGQVLVPNEQFKAVQLYQEATTTTGLEVTSVVVVIDPNVGSDVEITYQAIGGEFSYSVQALREMLTTLDLDNRPVNWGDILGTPTEYPAAPHLHDAGDLYGFEYLVEALDAIRRAVLIGNEAALDEIRSYVNVLDNRILPAATLEESLAGLSNDVVITPKTLKQSFDYFAALFLGDPVRSEAYAVHMSLPNPHDVTKALIGLPDVENTNFAVVDEALAAALLVLPVRP